MSFRIVIPARYASTRLPGKPLLEIAGKPMLQHVYERALQSGAESVVIATDDSRIQTVAEQFGAVVCMTSALHRSGTERLAEVVAQLNYADDEIIVNIQGDEPMIPPELIRQVANNLAIQKEVHVATLCDVLESVDALLNPNIVKVVMDEKGYALYFSRASIPYQAAQDKNLSKNLARYYRHIGLYAYRAHFIKTYIQWPPCYLEQMESLEQLRILWNGSRIHVGIVNTCFSKGIDTEKDLVEVRQMFSAFCDNVE